MEKITLLSEQLKRMRQMNKFYHEQFLIDVRYYFFISLVVLIVSFSQNKVYYLIPIVSLLGSVILAFHAYFLIFSRHYSEYLENKINNLLDSETLITHKLENKYFFPIKDKKIVVAKLGKDFSYFGFVTLFITFLGLAQYFYGMYNVYYVLGNDLFVIFMSIITLVTFIYGYFWFVNNEGEKRLQNEYE